jgi:hypothetical protein
MEAEEKVRIGWMPGIYPIRTTAEEALRRGDLFVYELEGIVPCDFNGIPDIQLVLFEKSHR